jgi:hypothetical protein
MNPEQDKNDYKRNFDARVAELKAASNAFLNRMPNWAAARSS